LEEEVSLKGAWQISCKVIPTFDCYWGKCTIVNAFHPTLRALPLVHRVEGINSSAFPYK